MLTIEIDTDNEAFQSHSDEDFMRQNALATEVARILDVVKEQVREVPAGAGMSRRIRDVNGNHVGQWTLVGE